MIRAIALSSLLLLLAASPSLAQFAPDQSAPKPTLDPALADKTAAAIEKLDADNLAQYKTNPDYLVRPGLLANRKEKWVRLYARATGIGQHDPVEFFAIPKDGGKDYEALVAAFVKPSDVHAALLFIGMTPGRPVNYAANRYWPKGERVLMTMQWTPDADAKSAPRKIRAEQMILDFRKDQDKPKPLPTSGLVFTGSYWITTDEGKKLLAADISDSRSIASDYNESASLLDVPAQAPQGEVYGLLKPNPAFALKGGQFVELLLEPEYKDAKKRVMDLSLSVSMPQGKAAISAAKFTLTDSAAKPLGNGNSLVDVLATFGKLVEDGHDPFVTITVAGGLSLSSVRELFTMIQSMDKDGGIRVEAPPPDQLYYRAFFPREEWRDRKHRLGRPWELHLGEKDDKVTGQLILPADDIDNNGGQGDLIFPVASPDETARILKEKSDKCSQVIYIFAPGEMKYGALLDFIRPAMATHGTMFVFLPKA